MYNYIYICTDKMVVHLHIQIYKKYENEKTSPYKHHLLVDGSSGIVIM